ncbi:MAG: apolipoprotein N-acyltransferase [Gemmatimonadota bacterium]
MTAAGRRQWALISAYALLTVLAYPPFNLLIPGFICVVPLIVLIAEAAGGTDPVWSAARIAFKATVVAQGVFLYWMVVALWHFTPLSVAGYLATVLLWSVWTGAMAAGVTLVWQRAPRVPRWLGFAAAWTTVEWIIGHFPDIQFPWLGLGHTLTGFPVLVQWAEIGGARGVTFWLAALNGLIAFAVLDPRRWRTAAVATAVTIAVAAGFGTWRMRTLPIRTAGTVAMIQPNIGFRDKWVESESSSIVAGMLAQTDSAIRSSHPDLVLWPEAAVPATFQARPAYAEAISRLARETATPILVGGLNYIPGKVAEDRGTFYNAAFYFDSAGRWQDYPVYAKHYLVPVVERVPFIPPRWLEGLKFFGAFGRGQATPLYQTPIGRVGTIICFESTFEDLARRYRREGAEVLVNITNDAWYGTTTAPGQHAAHLVMRAIETRAGIAQAANSGITEVVSPLGIVSHQTALESRATVIAPVETSDLIPLYVRWGDWVGVLSLVLSAGMLGLAILRPSRGP